MTDEDQIRISCPEDIDVGCSCGARFVGSGLASSFCDWVRAFLDTHRRPGCVPYVKDPEKFLDRFPDGRKN
jgi:hypothetical protein